jgi:amino acid adenylation domain-containing protein
MIESPEGRQIPFPRLFERQVEQTPDANAAAFGTAYLTYRALNARANRLAHYLAAQGVGPEVRVGVCLDRSLDLLVALLGVLKAGGAYVPLDPSYPADRLAYMLDDAAVPVVLTQETLRGSLPSSRAQVVGLEAAGCAIAACSAQNTGRDLSPDAVAYVIYTSGSTGRPKGAMIAHRGLSNYLLWAAEAYGCGAGHGVPVHSPIGFDLTVTSLFVPLVCGQCVWLVAPDQGVGALGEALSRDTDWTLVKITPAHLDVLARQLAPAAAAGQVRTFVVGGEMLRGESLAFWRAHAPATRIVNEYGPTETVVGCCVAAFPAAEAPDGPVPIGTPIAHTQLAVLDAQGQPVPAGEPGELYIGGAGVARGYLNQPALTASRFVPCAGVEGEASRVYRTGDRVQWRADGTLEFLGRLDEQVKIRGYRIELGEIETVLTAHPCVRDGVVLAREDTPGDRRLVAYVVWAGGHEAARALRASLRTQLPDYMVPAVIVTRAALPLTPNGKVDRKALPPPAVVSGPSPASITHEGEGDPLEAQIRDAWQDALGVGSIGLDEDFFELGGHSMHALVVVRRLEQSLRRDLPLSVMLRARTVRQLAALLRPDRDASVASCLVQIRAGAGRPPFYCVHGAAANILYLEGLARHLSPEIPLYGLQSRGLDGVQAPLTSAEAMAAHYIAEIRTVQPHGPYYLGGLSFGGAIAFEMAQQFHASGEAVGLVALMDTNLPTWRTYTANRSALFDSRIYPFVATLERNYVALRRAGVRGYLHQVRTSVLRRGASTDRDRPRAELPDGLTQTEWLSPTLEKIWKTNLAAADRYAPRVYPGKLTMFWATDWPTPSRNDARLCWADFAEDGLEVHRIPGSHGSFRFEPHVGVLADKLDLCLSRAHAAHAGKPDVGRHSPRIEIRPLGDSPILRPVDQTTPSAYPTPESAGVSTTGPALPRNTSSPSAPH